jgi:hypothetical protein
VQDHGTTLPSSGGKLLASLLFLVIPVVVTIVLITMDANNAEQEQLDPGGSTPATTWDEPDFEAAMTKLEGRGFVNLGAAARKLGSSTKKELLYSGNAVDWLYETDWKSIADATETISKLDPSGNESDCLVAALSHEEEIVRMLALMTWESADSLPPEAEQPLLGIVRQDSSTQLRRSAAQLLVSMGGSGIGKLGDLLHNHSDSESRMLILLVLAAGGLDRDNSPASQPLLEALKLRDADLRALAGAALLRTPQHQESGAAAAISGLESQDTSVRRICAIGLNAPGEVLLPHLDALIDAFANDDPVVRHLAALSLVGVKQQAVPALLAATSHDNPYVRYWTARCLNDEALPDREAVVTALLPLLSDEDESVATTAQQKAAETILDDNSAYQAYQQESYGIRGAAISTISALGTDSPEVIARLPELLDDPHWQVRLVTLLALEGITMPPDDQRALLTSSLSDENETVASRAQTLLDELESGQ